MVELGARAFGLLVLAAAWLLIATALTSMGGALRDARGLLVLLLGAGTAATLSPHRAAFSLFVLGNCLVLWSAYWTLILDADRVPLTGPFLFAFLGLASRTVGALLMPGLAVSDRAALVQRIRRSAVAYLGAMVISGGAGSLLYGPVLWEFLLIAPNWPETATCLIAGISLSLAELVLRQRRRLRPAVRAANG